MTLWEKFNDWWKPKKEEPAPTTSTDMDEEAFHKTSPIDSVQVDCRNCGKVNQVPGLKLQQKPKCGHCKVPLMPKTKIRIVTTAACYERVWHDYDGFWATVAAEYAPAPREERN